MKTMNTRADKLIGKFFLLSLLVSASAFRNVHAEPPTEFAKGNPTYTVSDQVSPPSSGIVWGATSEGYRDCDFARAGCPQCQQNRTIPSNTRFYGGYYVGGGTPTRGAGRCIEDGTWGWDYSGILFPKRIALNWTAKGRYQGGTGTYKTDGPKLRRE
jgi:hypothetical protein